jgi:preprotein translocase subunit SecG
VLYLLLPLQILSAIALLFLVLLHSGRGGGLSDLLGGGQGSANAAGSTVMERNLDRLTIVVALVFVFATMGTALLLDL